MPIFTPSTVRYVVYSRLGHIAFNGKRFRSAWAAKKHTWRRVPEPIQYLIGYVTVPVIRTPNGWDHLKTLAVNIPPANKRSRYMRRGNA